jgi:heme exporter protein C
VGKILAVLLVTYTIIAGFLVPSPLIPILHESIRNLYFHVPMWFAMTLMLCCGHLFTAFVTWQAIDLFLMYMLLLQQG